MMALMLLAATAANAEVPSSVLEEMLREEFVAYFSEDPTNAVALETAGFFRESKTPISLQLLPRDVLAQYSGRDGRIAVNYLPLVHWNDRDPPDSWWQEDIRRSIMESWRQNPQALRLTAERTSVVVVHEVSHALYGRSVGTDWNSVEQEMGCRAREMLFLHAKLRRDPSFLRLNEYDGLMRRTLETPRGPARNAALEPDARSGVIYPARRAPDDPPQQPGRPIPPRAWWRDPLPAGLQRQAVDDAEAEIRQRFPGEFDRITQPWYLTRLLNAGVDVYWDYLRSVLPRHYESLDQDWSRHLAERRREIARLDRRLRRAQGAEPGRLRVQLRDLRDHVREDEAFRRDTDQVRAYRAFFVAEEQRLHGLLEKELEEGRAGEVEPAAP